MAFSTVRQLFQHGVELGRAGQYHAAIDVFRSALELRPDARARGMLLYNISSCYARGGEQTLVLEAWPPSLETYSASSPSLAYSHHCRWELQPMPGVRSWTRIRLGSLSRGRRAR